MTHHLITLHALDRRPAEACLPELERALEDARIGTLDAAGMLEIELDAPSREAAHALVREAIADVGAEERLTFPATTGTGYPSPAARASGPTGEA